MNPQHTVCLQTTKVCIIIYDFNYSIQQFLFLVIMFGLVSDDTVHLSHIDPPFGTQGSSTLDISIASYTITCFIYFCYLLYSTGKEVD